MNKRRGGLGTVWYLLSIIGLFMLLTKTLIGLSPAGLALAAVQRISPALQAILDQAYQAPLYQYPTSLTQGIVPVNVHSHNDYWRPVPLYSALAAGCISIEADVWLYDGTLYVGHEESALTRARTFAALYVDPLLSILRAQNPPSPFVKSDTRNGVFDTEADQTLYLFVDFKTDADATYDAVVAALEPLRRGGWLSTVRSGSSAMTTRPVTVVGTGNTPKARVAAASDRDLFYDAPLAALNGSDITALVSPIASTEFARHFPGFRGPGFSEKQLALLRAQLAGAHARGIMARYWGAPAWPISTRDGIWRTLWTEGADLINADDVEAAAGLAGQGERW